MENFTNETIDTTKLPKFEEVEFTTLNPNYWRIIVLQFFFFFLILGVAILFVLFFNEEVWKFRSGILIIYVILILLSFLFSRIGFQKKGFAFRNHDVLFKHGILATKTIIIPYNRVQHVALHEGFLSRYFGLATIAIFTAGGSSSDIEIPGIEKEQAENIKHFVMGKIQKQL